MLDAQRANLSIYFFSDFTLGKFNLTAHFWGSPYDVNRTPSQHAGYWI